MKILRIPLTIVLVVVAGRAVPVGAQSEMTLYSFGSVTGDGTKPYAGLVMGSDSNFYGTTSAGDANNAGGVFRITSSGDYSNLYDFGTIPDDGEIPTCNLVQGSDGNFYGTTLYGGSSPNCQSGCGSIFRISPSGDYTNLYSFEGSFFDGAEPVAGLVQGSDSNFYGTTSLGGESGSGTVFRISASGTYASLYSFGASSTDGLEPDAGLVQGIDGYFYGTTVYGGTSGRGTIYRISSSGSYTSLYSFAKSGADGNYPEAPLVQGSDTNFYGTTYGGGKKKVGTIYRIAPGGSYSSLYSFGSVADDGANPYDALVQYTDGNFYGTTLLGGKEKDGTIFRISPSGSYMSLVAFGAAADDGTEVPCALVVGVDSNFYGTSFTGGANGDGAFFVFDVNGSNSNSGGCTYTLNATSVALAAKGGSKTVSVKVKGTDCAWTAVSNDPFITIISGSNGTASGKVAYSVPGNTNSTTLTGTMTIAGQTFTVNQAAGGCSYKLSPKDGKFKSTGGTGTVKVTPNLSDCAWTAVSTDSFITITGGTNGVGKGTVTYTVPANDGTNALTGTISIAGQTFTVTQAAPK